MPKQSRRPPAFRPGLESLEGIIAAAAITPVLTPTGAPFLGPVSPGAPPVGIGVGTGTGVTVGNVAPPTVSFPDDPPADAIGAPGVVGDDAGPGAPTGPTVDPTDPTIATPRPIVGIPVGAANSPGLGFGGFGAPAGAAAGFNVYGSGSLTINTNGLIVATGPYALLNSYVLYRDNVPINLGPPWR